jgi:ureidoglycolate hydrolase
MTTSVRSLLSKLVTSESFQPYGQLITASVDGKSFDRRDALLSLEKGIPRFYIMRLHKRGLKFNKITRHQMCTQCLGSLEGKEWSIAVAPPSEKMQPNLEEIVAFRIPGNCFIKLEVGTWHAGPYFEDDVIDFYNLELSDTNVVDHFTHDLLKCDNLELEIIH